MIKLPHYCGQKSQQNVFRLDSKTAEWGSNLTEKLLNLFFS